MSIPLAKHLKAHAEPVLVTLRTLLRRTPPQTEAGWKSAAKVLPLHDTGVGQWRKVESYNAASDYLFITHAWSLASMSSSERQHYFWRDFSEAAETADRRFNYFVRSQTFLG